MFHVEQSRTKTYRFSGTKRTEFGTKVTGNLGVYLWAGEDGRCGSPLHKTKKRRCAAVNAKLFHVEHRTHDRRNTVQIVDLNTEEMVDICVRLVREGVTFRASPMGYGTWMIVFTGGY